MLKKNIVYITAIPDASGPYDDEHPVLSVGAEVMPRVARGIGG